ncbi:putative reverse transcriptase domain-containing protein [Tanacetum coccineum]
MKCLEASSSTQVGSTLSGLPLVREIEFRIKLVPGAMPVAKYPYCLAPSKLEELSGQLKELQEKAKPLTVLTHKIKTYDWGEEQENAFQNLKDKLFNAHVLALPDRLKDFVVYCDVSGLGLGCVLMRRGKVIAYASRQLKIHEKNYTTDDVELGAVIELFSDYDCEIRYHPGKANVGVDALSRKDKVKPMRVRAMNMTLQSSIKDRILVAQKEASDESARLKKGLDEMIELRNDEALYYLDPIWVPLKGDVRTLIMDEAHKSKYYVHPGADKMYYDLRDRYWWPGMKKEIAVYAEIGEGQLIGPELVQETTEKISQIKDRLKAARDYQKSYANKRRKPLEFSVGDYVLLKVPPWKGVVRFGNKGKLTHRFVRPFEVIKKVGPVAYRLDLPEELNGVHDTFHMSNLKKCLADPTLQVPLDEIQVEANLNFVEDPMEILEREIKKLKHSRIAIVKVWYVIGVATLRALVRAGDKTSGDASSPSTTPVIGKIDKIEKLIIDRKVTLVDDEGKPLEKVAYLGDYDSEDEVASIDSEMASFLRKKDSYGT